MAATNKTELITVTNKEFEKLSKLIADISAQMALVKDDGDTSIKDIIAHRAEWIEMFLGWYDDGMAGKTVYFPAKGYKWNELKRYNAELRLKQTDLGWEDAVQLFQTRAASLLEFMETHSDEQLYSGPMKGANNDWTPGRWAEAAGPSHYRSAAKYVRVRLKSL